jgi:branched-chain amino acid transport system ATP-binding protein
MSGAAVLLELRDVRKSFKAMKVIRGLDIQVAEGEFVGVIGPNGAGKTTAFGLISGNLQCDTGTVLLNGVDVTKATADHRCRLGIGRTFQIPQPFQNLSVLENVLVGATFGASLNGRAAMTAAMDAVAACGLLAVADQQAGALTLLQRKRLELARAMATNPQLLLLDEVGGGLTDAEMQELLGLVVNLHRAGVTILWIEHIVHALVSVAKRLIVLADGAILADGLPSEVIASALVRQTYLGDELAMEAEVA